MSGGVFDSASIDKMVSEKEALTGEPGFWDDPKNAEKVMSQIRKLKNRVEPWRALITDMDDLEAMYELAAESGEQSDEDEVRSMYDSAKEKFEKLNILNLLSGEVDQNDAYLTIHAGAGGTEACDWCFMLSRMYLRWAERHGYKTEVMDELEAEGGLKSITIQISGDFVYGYLKGEGGIHRLVCIATSCLRNEWPIHHLFVQFDIGFSRHVVGELLFGFLHDTGDLLFAHGFRHGIEGHGLINCPTEPWRVIEFEHEAVTRSRRDV